VEDRKEPPARGLPLTLDCYKVQVGLVLSSCKQFNAPMQEPGCSWHGGGLNGTHVGPRLRIHFRQLNWRPSIEPPHACSSSSPKWAPSRRYSVQWTRSAIPVNCCGAQHVPVASPLFTFGCQPRPGFEFSPHARAGPKAAAVGDEECNLLGELVRAQHAVVLLPNPGLAARVRYLFVHV
jgi:hypothetical protein